MTKPIFDYAARAAARRRSSARSIRMQRHGDPEEIAAMALYSSRATTASYVNGQAIAVDGGLSSTHPFVGKLRV
jgi:NAD(P)-dependent dehydrogenase (short-subunit alcohol dehydrogenase family)